MFQLPGYDFYEPQLATNKQILRFSKIGPKLVISKNTRNLVNFQDIKVCVPLKLGFSCKQLGATRYFMQRGSKRAPGKIWLNGRDQQMTISILLAS